MVTDGLWSNIKPLIWPERPKPKGGRPRVPDRVAPAGMIFVLRTGIPWEYLPKEFGCSGMTHSLRSGQALLAPAARLGAGRRPARLHRALLERLEAAGAIDWSRASLDGASVPAKGGGADQDVGPNPVDRGTPGSERHVLVDRNGVPLAVRLTAANVHDREVFGALIESVRPIERPGPGRPRTRPAKLHADKAYDLPRCREYLGKRAITCRIAREGVESSERPGRYRWVVERTLAWLARYRRPAIRHERLADRHLAFLDLAFAPICFKTLRAARANLPLAGAFSPSPGRSRRRGGRPEHP